MKKLLWLTFFLALVLRLYRIGIPVFKDEEFSAVSAAAYIYQCQQDSHNCIHQPRTFRSKLLALITANETVPNFLTEVYLWDFIKDEASAVHQSRAWPHLYAVAAAYKWLGISEFSSRLVSALAGSLLVITGFWFSRILGSSIKLSLLYSVLLAMAFPLIDFSRNARMYSLFVLAFIFLVGLIYRSRWLAVGLAFLLAYWLHMLTLVLPLAILVWLIEQRRWRPVGILLAGLAFTAWLNYYFNVDFFGRQFLGLTWPPHWQYLNWWWILALVLLLAKHQWYLLSIILTYLTVLIFFSRPEPGSAYTIMLWPLALWPLLNWRRWLTWLVVLIILIGFVVKINYLYFGRDGRPQIKQAYRTITGSYQTGDKIYAVQLRDYYLQKFPEDTEIIDLQKHPDLDFSGFGFVVWEEEKSRHFKPEVLEYIRTNFKYLGSEGVEIYSFGK